MKKNIILFCFLLMFLVAAPCSAEILDIKINFRYEYPVIAGLEAPTSYNLYCEGTLVHAIDAATTLIGETSEESNGQTTITLIFEDDFFIESGGASELRFTLTAVIDPDLESAHSPVYIFTVIETPPPEMEIPQNFQMYFPQTTGILKNYNPFLSDKFDNACASIFYSAYADFNKGTLESILYAKRKGHIYLG